MGDEKAPRKLKVIEVGGTPYEMGFQHGSACPEIERMIDVTCRGLAIKRDDAAVVAQKYLPSIEEFAPSFVEEMKGVAEGAKVDFREIAFLNVWYEISVFKTFFRPFGCTSFAARGGATSNGEVIIGQNLDMAPEWEGMLILLKMKPEEGPGVLSLGLAGMSGLLSMNSAGITVDGNFLIHRDFISSAGIVPHMAIVRKIQSSENMGHAIGTIASARRGPPFNLLLGSSEGDLIDIEVMPDDLGVIYPDNDIIVHTNHFETERFKNGDIIGTALPDSYIRSHRMALLMETHRGNLSVDIMKNLLQDHNNRPGSICRHADPKAPPILQMKTIASLISHPEEQKMHIALGNPCENGYIEYGL